MVLNVKMPTLSYLAATLIALLSLSACGSGDAGHGTLETVGGVIQLDLKNPIAGGMPAGLLLSDGTDSQMPVPAGASTFTFPTALYTGQLYAVSVNRSPTGLTCTVTDGVGRIGSGMPTQVVVTCSDLSFSLGGSISGLSAIGLVLTDGIDALAVQAGRNAFTFPTQLAYDSNYSVSVQSEPPGLACTVSGATGKGKIATSDVSSVSVVCSDLSYTLGGTISGLVSGGLTLADATEALAVPTGAQIFDFPTPLAFGAEYQVSIQAQPAGETCSFNGDSNAGRMTANGVNTVSLNCSMNAYTLGGAIAGLNYSGLLLTDGTDALAPGVDAVTFTFPTALAFETRYLVSVLTQPLGLACSVLNGEGQMLAGNVTSVAVDCIPNPTETILESLPAVGQGTNAEAGSLVLSSSGAIYGIFRNGGANGTGAVFELTPPTGSQTAWTETVLYSFGVSGKGDGASPIFLGLPDSQGNLYGITLIGGAIGGGTVFMLSPPGNGRSDWSETILHSFRFSQFDGNAPNGGLIRDAQGNLFGTTGAGGSNGFGTVFQISPPGSGRTDWTETLLYSFGPAYSLSGTEPLAGLVQDAQGNLYGTTYEGGTKNEGTVFELSPPGASNGAWTETVLYSFGANGTADAMQPSTELVMDGQGNLYGATWAGGAQDRGAVFEVSPPAGGGGAWTETVLHSFQTNGDYADGNQPSSILLRDGQGNLYGVTYWGGGTNSTSSGSGVIYELSPPNGSGASWSETILYAFGSNSSADGANPGGKLIEDGQGYMYGTTAWGGTNDYGTVYRFVP